MIPITDLFSSEKRSQIMSKIRSKNTKIEMLVRKWLFAFGYRYRINDKRYPGTPDIVLPKYKTVIFINGCFWHQHTGCKISHMPKSNTAYWFNKLNKNLERDEAKLKCLEEMGWDVIIIWECELSSNPEERLIRLLGEIRGVDYTYC